MHILITDSGVGGLSVVAYAERFVRIHGFTEPVRLTFANAAPENDFGYNSMATRQEKLATFDRFLRSVTERFVPDSIYVACNTLSVLLPETPWFHIAPVPIKGIVESGLELLLHELQSDPRRVAMIFGTQTTIETGTYARLLEQRGVDPSRIISQACPGLADTISEDREGSRAADEIRGWVSAAVSRLGDPSSHVLAYLACTHYGYRRELFIAAFDDAEIESEVLNPNERAAHDLFGEPAENGGAMQEVDVQFVTRYRIPETTVDALSWFLNDISPRTVDAMRNFVHMPDLF